MKQLPVKRLVPALIVIGIIAALAYFNRPSMPPLKAYAHAEVDPNDPSRFKVRDFDYPLILDDFGMNSGAVAAMCVLKHGHWSLSTDPKRCAHEDVRAFAQAEAGCLPSEAESRDKAADCVVKALISTFNFDPDRRREYAADVAGEVKSRLIDLAGQ
jgi:hypothetical protein